ncbi:hypothetical protein MSG28_011937 [Choristoneura fumiferana]|uniref:Uncharacterized protein n=1 Tax=Choristoneura fumiferana TaxID=7141 RepID=A0ACC0KNI1_CHOFU|nr:hypothetical protein MSG28_011937 [Choristoneura fumiferana]
MTIIQFIILNVLSHIWFSSQHFIPPLHNCIVAEMCNHTWVPICGFDKTSTNIRSFPDECDMIEYNCDFKTDYVQTDHEKCRNINNDDVNKTSDIITTPSSSGRRSNVESVLNDPEYVTSTYPYRGDEEHDDESYLEDVSTTYSRSTNNIKTVLPPGNFAFSTTKSFIDANKTYIISNNTVTTMIFPSLTITDTELVESKTVASTDSLRHGPQCTCDQHTTTEMMTTVTESTTVSLVTECTRHKLTTAPTSKTISTIHTTTTEVVTTTDQIINETTTEHASFLSTTTAEPTMTSEVTTKTTTPINETGGDCTCYMNTTPVMTTSSITTEETTAPSTTTPTISITSPTPITTMTNADITTTSEMTTITSSAPVNETGGKCTCYLNTTPVIPNSSITTEETAALSTIIPTTLPTTTITIIETTTVSPDRKCTCNMQTNPVTTTLPTTDVSTTTTTAATTTVTTTTVPITTTTTSLISTSTEPTTTPAINIRECTCGQTPIETTTTSESTTITEPSTTRTELTTTVVQDSQRIRLTNIANRGRYWYVNISTKT